MIVDDDDDDDDNDTMVPESDIDQSAPSSLGRPCYTAGSTSLTTLSNLNKTFFAIKSTLVW